MKHITILIFIITLFSCKKKDAVTDPLIIEPMEDNFIRSADLSFLPEIEQTGTVFYNKNNVAKDVLTILKDNGCNTIRLRLWHSPSNIHSSLSELTAMATRIKAAGLRVWLDIHYSDRWADPGAQTKPSAWQSLPLAVLKDSVYSYTKRVVQLINPYCVQVGNEINDGFLWPEGKLSTNSANFIELLKAGCKAVKDVGSNSRIIIHYAGINGASQFYDLLRNNNVDYDMVGLSYYPMYHGLNLTDVQSTMNTIAAANKKEIVIAETSYPFTLGYNDYTNNTLGLASQTIPVYPPTADGQRNFLLALRNIVEQNPYGAGICYWAPDWVAYRGPIATNGSSAENQALFDFNNKELPATEIFKK